MDSVWLPDPMLGFLPPEMGPVFPISAVVSDPDSGHDPFCVAAILGRSTSLLIGTATDATRRRLVDLARTTLTLHHSAKGGFILGIGSGKADSLLPYDYERQCPAKYFVVERSSRSIRFIPISPTRRNSAYARNANGLLNTTIYERRRLFMPHPLCQ